VILAAKMKEPSESVAQHEKPLLLEVVIGNPCFVPPTGYQHRVSVRKTRANHITVRRRSPFGIGGTRRLRAPPGEGIIGP